MGSTRDSRDVVGVAETDPLAKPSVIPAAGIPVTEEEVEKEHVEVEVAVDPAGIPSVVLPMVPAMDRPVVPVVPNLPVDLLVEQTAA